MVQRGEQTASEDFLWFSLKPSVVLECGHTEGVTCDAHMSADGAVPFTWRRASGKLILFSGLFVMHFNVTFLLSAAAYRAAVSSTFPRVQNLFCINSASREPSKLFKDVGEEYLIRRFLMDLLGRGKRQESLVSFNNDFL